MAKIRLDKAVADYAGITRSQARELLKSKRVAVDGRMEKLFDYKFDPERQSLAVDGRELCAVRHLYLMLHKPQGYLSATRDRRAPTVLDLVPPEYRRKGLFPAGRLDQDTEGLVLLTDDGQLAHRILSPRRHIPKTYFVTLDRPMTCQMAERFAAGMDLGGGEASSPARLEISGEDPCSGRVVIYEGIYHQIKRMFQRCGAQVVYLKRLAMGGLWLDEALEPGQCRPITEEEKNRLFMGETD